MKLRRLDIHNIASIGDATINFDSAPLCDTDVFLICGETGAGKSTILDAICLALFGYVPRLGSSRGDKYNDISHNDQRQLLRAGCGEGFVKLSFDGNDNHFYEAEWQVRRARNKPTGKFQDVRWSLIRDGQRSEAITHSLRVRQAVVEALGIDYDQFVRTSMLAQGEFTRFLKAADNEKSAILEKLTGTTIYTRVGAEIYRLSEEKKRAYDILLSKIEAESLLSPDELASLKKELEDVAADCTRLQADGRLVAGKIAWLERHAISLAAVEKAKKDAEAAATNLSSRRMLEIKEAVALWNETSSVRAAIDSIKATEKESEEVSTTLKLLEREWLQALANEKKGAMHLDTLVREAANIDLAIEDRAWQVEIFAQYDDLITNLDRQTQLRDKERETIGELKQIEKALVSQNTNLTSTKAQLDQLTQACVSQEAKILKSRDEMAKKDLSSLLKRQQELQTSLAEGRGMTDSLKTVSNELALYEEESGRQQNLKAKIESLKAVVEVECAKLPEAEAQMKQAASLLEVLDFSNEQWATSARATLKKGCTCPVCLQTVAQMPPIELKLREQLELARSNASEANNKYSAIKEKIAACTAELAQCERQFAETSTKLKATLADLDRKRKTIADKCAQAGMKDNLPALEAHTAMLEKALMELSTDVKSATDLHTNHTFLQQKYAELISRKEELIKRLSGIDAECNGLKTRKQLLEKLRQDNHDTLCHLLSVFESLPALERWNVSAKDYPAELKKILKEEKLAYNSLQDRRTTLKAQIDKYSEALATARASMDSIKSRIPHWASMQAEITQCGPVRIADLEAKVYSAINHRDRLDVQAKQYAQIVESFLTTHLDRSRVEIERLMAIGADNIAKMEAELVAAKEILLKAEAAVEENVRQLASLESQKPELSAEDNVETLRIQASELNRQIEESQKTQGAMMRRLAEDGEARARQKELIDLSDKTRKEWIKWQRLNDLLGSATGEKFNRIAQSFILADLLERANKYLVKLTDRYKLCGVEGQYLILLEDAYNGYLRRPVITSSGGESFMVSLSLALALADAGTSFSSDILFIDEGFGTLSGEPLQRAVGMLRSLHRSSGKRVGIISHVAQLRSEIPVQLVVSRPPTSVASKIEVKSLSS